MARFFRRCALLVVLSTLLSVVGVGCGTQGESPGASGAGGSDLTPLEGVWFGLATLAGNVSLIVEDLENVDEVLIAGVPTGTMGTFAKLEDEIFELVPAVGTRSLLLTDGTFDHGFFLLDNLVSAVEKDPPLRSPAFSENDVVGSWSGYGYAYNGATGQYEKDSPVEALVSLTFPSSTRTFEVTLSGGATIEGTIVNFEEDWGFWVGATNTGVDVVIAMSVDKEFVGVLTENPSAPDSQRFMYFALNKLW